MIQIMKETSGYKHLRNNMSSYKKCHKCLEPLHKREIIQQVTNKVCLAFVACTVQVHATVHSEAHLRMVTFWSVCEKTLEKLAQQTSDS